MRIFTFILFILVICKFCILHYWCILHYCIFYGDCYNVLASLVFIVFYSTVFKYGYNDYDYLRVIFRVLCYFMFGCFFFLVFALLLCLCVNILHFFVCLLILTTIIHQQVLLFFIFMLILTKMRIAIKVIITPLQKIIGYFFQPLSYSWKFGSIKVVT